MRVYAYDRADTGEYVDPLPLNNELRNLVARANSLDRWAFAAAFTTTKLATTVFGKFKRATKTATQSKVLQAVADFHTPAVQMIPMETDVAATPWVETFTSSDAVLCVDLLGTFRLTQNNGKGFVRPFVTVDGRLAALGPTMGRSSSGVREDSFLAAGSIPVAAGTHRIEPFFFAWHLDAFATFTVELKTRTVSIRECAR